MANSETLEKTNHIPTDDELQIVSGGKSWRFAMGQIVRGKAHENELGIKTGQFDEVRKSITGELRRIGIFSGKTQQGQPYAQIEADIQTHDELLHVKSSLMDEDGITLKPSVSTLGFAWGLLQFKKNELLRIETSLGEPIDLRDKSGNPTGKKGGRPTYVNFYVVKDGKAIQIFKERRDASAPKLSTVDQWLEMEPQIKAHDAYAERAAEPGSSVQFEGFVSDVQAKGWPTPYDLPGSWLDYIAKGFKHERRANLTDYTEAEWANLRSTFAKVADVPAPIAAAKKKADEESKKPAPVADSGGFSMDAAGEEPDPFAG